MKTKNLICLLATVVFSLANTSYGWCDVNSTIWLNAHKGGVKVCKEYMATAHSGKLIKGDLNSIKKYDKKGNMLEWCEFENAQTISKKNVYTYDSKGNQTEWLIYDNNNALTSKHIFKYDNNGNAIEEREYNGKDSLLETFTFRYNAKNQLIEKCCYKIHDCQEWKCTYLYNEKGDQTEWNKNDVSCATPHFERWTKTKYLYKYDRKGNIIERASIDLQDEPSGKYTYKHKKGHVKEMCFYNEFDTMIGKNRYTYDKNGNCIELYMYAGDHKLIGGYLYEHEYYK